MDLLGKIRELVQVVFQTDDQDIILKPNATTTYTAETTVSLPNNAAVTQELTGNAATQTLTNKTIVAANNTVTTAAAGNIASTELDAAIAEGDTNLTTHIDDATDAHAGSAITNTPAGNLAATTVQAALDEVQTELDIAIAHIADATAAHAASAISNTPAGNLAATTLQAAVDELQTELDAATAHIIDAVAAHAATAISNTPAGNLAAITVQAALDELQTELDLAITAVVDDTAPQLGGDLDVNGSDIVSVSNGNISILPNGSGTVLLDSSTTVTGNGIYVGGDQGASVGMGVNSSTSGIGNSSMTTTNRDAISSPATGLQIFNTTTGVMNIYDGSIWVAVGAGGGSGSGEINYISGGDAETGTTGWATYDDGAVAAPVDGTGGSPSTMTLTTQATTILRGDNSFKLAKSAANGQGEGISYDFTIDIADKNKLLKISMDYNTDLTYTSEDYKIYIYDVTNATLITPADNGIIGVDKDDDSSGARTIGWASTDSVSYRLIIHQTTTNASTADLYFDNVIVGPGSVATGAVVTAWESYTPTTNGWGTITSRAQWRRVGDSVEIMGDFALGTVTSGEAQIGLPNGLTIDMTAASGNRVVVGELVLDATSSDRFLLLGTHAETHIEIGTWNRVGATNIMAPLDASGFATSQVLTMKASVPIAEFAGSGTVNLMSDNVAAANAKAFFSMDSGSTLSSGVNDVIPDNFNIVSGFSYNAGTGAITPLFTGTIQVATALRAAADQTDLNLRIKDGTSTKVFATHSGASGASQIRGSGTYEVTSGVPITIESFSVGATTYSGTAGLDNYIDITRVADYSAGQPVGFGIATADTYGLVKKRKYSSKTNTVKAGGSIAANTQLFDGTTPTGTVLTLTSLVVGRVYKVHFSAFLAANIDASNASILMTDGNTVGSTKIMQLQCLLDTGTTVAENTKSLSGTATYTAATTNLYFWWTGSNNANVSIRGDAIPTKFIIEDITDDESTSDWD